MIEYKVKKENKKKGFDVIKIESEYLDIAKKLLGTEENAETVRHCIEILKQVVDANLIKIVKEE